MSLGDAYADAHLDLDALDVDIEVVEAKLRRAVARWEEIGRIDIVVDVDTTEGGARLASALRQWNEMAADGVTVGVTMSTDGATGELRSAMARWQADVDSGLSTAVDMDTAAASEQLGAAVDGWGAVLDAGLVARVDLDTVGASQDLDAAMAGWQGRLDRALTGVVDIDTAQASADLAATSIDWGRYANVAGRVDLDTGAATADLLAAVAEWEAILAGVNGNVSLGMDRDSVSIMREAADAIRDALNVDEGSSTTNIHALLSDMWALSDLAEKANSRFTGIGERMQDIARHGAASSSVIRSLTADLTDASAAAERLSTAMHFTTETDGTADLVLAMEQWQALASEGVRVRVDVDPTEGDTSLAIAFDEWTAYVREGLAVGIDMGTLPATETLGSAYSEWEALVADGLVVGVDMETIAATEHLEAAAARWHAITADALSVDVDMDTLAATEHLEAAAAGWRAIVAENPTVNIDMDTTAASEQLAVSIEAWRRDLDDGLSTTVDVSTTQASADLAATAERWEEILRLSARVTVDSDESDAAATGARLRAELGDLTVTPDLDDEAVTSGLAASVAEWQRVLDRLVVTPGMDTDPATGDLAAAVVAWQRALDLTGTVRIDTDAADRDVLVAAEAWRAEADSVTVTPRFNEGRVAEEIEAANALWRSLLDDLVVTPGMDTATATEELAAAVERWKRIASVTANVDVDASDEDVAAVAVRWQRLVDSLVVTPEFDDEAVTAELTASLLTWQDIVDRLRVDPEVDTTTASEELARAVEEWNRVAAVRAEITVDPDDAEVAATAARWRDELSSLTVRPDFDGAPVDADIAAAAARWQSLVDGLTVTPDVDTATVSEHLAEASAEWRTLIGDVSSAVDLDTARATEQLGATVDEWDAVLRPGFRSTVDLDTAAATADLTAAVQGWRDLLTRAPLSTTVDVDTARASEQLAAANAAWQAAVKEVHVQVDVDDAGSLANLAATFEGLKPLLNLPVRFHLDQPSVIAATSEIEALAASWSSALDVSVRVNPTGTNDLPDRRPRAGEPAQARAPTVPSAAPVVRPRVDGTTAEIEARALDRVLDDILDIVARVRVDGDAALSESEALAPLIERTLASKARVTLDDDGLIAYADAVHAVLQQVLGDLAIRPEFDGSRVVARAEALAEVLDNIRATVELILDDSPVAREAPRVREETKRKVGAVDVPVRPTSDSTTVADARTVNRLIEGLLKVVVPVDLDGSEAVTQAEALSPLIDQLLRVTAEAELDGSRVVAQAEALDALLDEIIRIVVPVDVDGSDAVGQAQAVRGILSGVLRDQIIRVTASGGDAQAEGILIRETLERALGSITIPVKPEVKPGDAALDAAKVKKLIEGLVKITAPVNLDSDRALTDAAQLRPAIAELLDITARPTIEGGKAVAQAEALERLISQAVDITFRPGVDNKAALAQAAQLRTLLEGVLRDLVISMEVQGGEATREAVLLVETLQRAIGTLRVDVDLNTKGAEGHAIAFKAWLSRVAGRFDIDVDLDTKGAAAHVPLIRAWLSALKSDGSGIEGLFQSAAGAADMFTKAVADGAGIGKQFGVVMQAVGGEGLLSFVTGIGAVFASLLKLQAILGTIAIGLPLIVGGIMGLLSAAGGLVGLAGGFATLAGSIGLAGAAAGALGIALNADLLERVKNGLAGLKGAVAEATRDVGETLIDRYQKPFIGVITGIAQAASQIALPLITPVADAALRFLNQFNSLLRTGAAQEFAANIGQGIGQIIDLFDAYLPAYLRLINQVFGASSGLQDLIRNILDLGLQAGPLFIALGDFVSGFSNTLGDIGKIALPMVTKLVDLFTHIVESDPFRDIVQGGILAFSGLIDIIERIGDGLRNVGIEGAMATVADAFERLGNSDFGEKIGEFFAMILNEGARAFDMFSQFLSSPFFEQLIDWVNAALPLVNDLFYAFVGGFSAVGGDNAIISFLKDLLPLLNAAKVLASGLGMVLGVVFDTVGFVAKIALTALESIGLAGMQLLAEVGLVAVRLVKSIGIAYDMLTPGKGSNRITDWATETERSLMEWRDNGTAAVGDMIGSMWDLDSTASDVTASFGEFGSATQRAETHARQFSETLGVGADFLERWGVGMPTEAIDAAGEAAAEAADKFKNTTSLIAKMREEAAKPITLSVDFEKTRLDLDKLVTYVAGQMKTVKDEASTVVADPTTEALAKNVKGADGSNLADASSQQYVPEHLEQSIAQSVEDLYENVQRDIENDVYLRELRFKGYGALADQLATFDGPKLTLAIKELGDAASAEVRKANAKILDAQREADRQFNPFQATIDKRRMETVLRARQAQIVEMLESAGLDDVAGMVAAVEPDQLEAAIRTIDSVGPAAIAEWERQIDEITAAAEQYATEKDPLGKAFTAMKNTPGAREGLIGTVLQPSEIALSTFGTEADQTIRQNMANALMYATNKDGDQALGQDQIAQLVDEWWTSLINGDSDFLPKLPKGIVNRSGLEALLRTVNQQFERRGTYLTPAQQEQEAGLARVQKFLESDIASIPEADRKEAERWKSLWTGIDQATGKAIGESPGFKAASNPEAKVIEMLTARGVARKGGSVAADGTVTDAAPGVTESRQAGLDQASAFASGIGSNPEAVVAAANDLVKKYTDSLFAASEAWGPSAAEYAKGLLATLGGELTNQAPGMLQFAGLAVPYSFGKAIEGASLDPMMAAAGLLISTFSEVVGTYIGLFAPELFFKGKAMVQYLLDGVTDSSENEAWTSGAAVLLNLVDGMDQTQLLLNEPLSAIGGRMAAAISEGLIASQVEPENGANAVTFIQGLYFSMVVLAAALRPRFVAVGSLVSGSVAVGFASAADTALDRAAALPGDIAAKLRDSQGTAIEQARSTGEAIGRGISEGINRALGGATGGAASDSDADKAGGRKAAAAASRAAADKQNTPGVDMGHALADGIILGLFQKLPELISAANRVADAVAQAMRDHLGVKSPSQVTMTIGEQIVEGLALGLEDRANRAVVTAQSLADRVSKTIEDGVKPKVGAVAVTVGTDGADQPTFPPPTFPPPPPGATMTASGPETAFLASQAAPAPTPAAAPDWTVQQAAAAARGGSGPFIHADKLEINGVPGVEAIPEYTDRELWRLGYGESPRRKAP